jgi:hypothetical protein
MIEPEKTILFRGSIPNCIGWKILPPCCSYATFKFVIEYIRDGSNWQLVNKIKTAPLMTLISLMGQFH